MVHLKENGNAGDSSENDTNDIPKCLERKTVRKEPATPLYPAPCNSDMPCHCENLNLEQPKFLSAICDMIPIENSLIYPYGRYCHNDHDAG